MASRLMERSPVSHTYTHAHPTTGAVTTHLPEWLQWNILVTLSAGEHAGTGLLTCFCGRGKWDSRPGK